MRKICAIIACRNEEVYLPSVLEYLDSNDVDVVVLDNGSTDKTLEIAKSFLSKNVIEIRHIPFEGSFDLTKQLNYKKEVADRLNYEWILHQDADEILCSSRPGEKLSDLVVEADRLNKNVINFEEYVFLPPQELHAPEGNYRENCLDYYFFEPSRNRLMRLWKNGEGLDNTQVGGHCVKGDVRLFPVNGILKHYIGTSRARLSTKYRDRVFAQSDLNKGWHRSRTMLKDTPIDFQILNVVQLPRACDAEDICLIKSEPKTKHFWAWQPPGAKRKIYLHVGLPKTATTTLQTWAYANQQELLRKNIWYPDNAANDPVKARHTRLRADMMSGDFTWTKKTLSQSENDILFSIEGLSWHVNDFPEKNLSEFRRITSDFDVVLIVVLRSPESWALSMYRQCLVNPVMPKCLFGTAKTFEEFKREPRIKLMMDQEALLNRLKGAFGACRLVTAAVETNWAESISEELKIGELGEGLNKWPAKNIGFNQDYAEIVRQINSLNLENGLRWRSLYLLQKSAGSNIDIIREYGIPVEMKDSGIVDQLHRVFTRIEAANTAQKNIQDAILRELGASH